MGPITKLYAKWIFPRVMDSLLDQDELAIFRSRLLENVTGEVLEIGFGTGLNLVHYPKHVTKLVAVDSNPGMSHLAHERLSDVLFPVEHHLTGAEKLPWEDNTFDAVVSTWTLCSVDDVDSVLSEIRRVLKKGGKFYFLEHGVAKDKKVEKWQNRLNPLNRRLAAGCELTRDIRAHLKASGLTVEECQEFYLDKVPKTHGYMYYGKALKAE